MFRGRGNRDSGATFLDFSALVKVNSLFTHQPV
jgi:hypothetical protein